MDSFKRFEDIEAWKKARNLTREIYETTADGLMARDFALSNQMRRAAISVMLNTAEGSARRTDREFGQHLLVAIGSIAEIQSALYIAIDQRYIDQRTFDRLYNKAAEIGRMLSGLIKYLRSSSDHRADQTTR